MPSRAREKYVIKPMLFILCLLPLNILLWNAFNETLSANPISDITNETGIWTLRFLLLSLSITPIRILTGVTSPVRFRRMIGLFAFFYVCLHFTTYIWLDKFFDTGEIFRDVAKRKFITVGFSSFVLLIPLAITSSNRIMKALGGKKWKRLHRLAYVAGLGGVLHYLWLVKADLHRPLSYAAILSLLLGIRFWKWFQGRTPKKSVASATPQITFPVEESGN